MTEFLSKTHAPGSDGQTFGVAPDQSVLYDWMRVLAGGGTSEFSAIRMRGPLTLSNGSLVTGARAVQAFINGTYVYNTESTNPTGPLPQVVTATGSPTANDFVSGGLVLVAGDTVVIRNSSGVTFPKTLVTISLSALTSACGADNVIFAHLKQGANIVPGFEPQATVLTATGNDQSFVLTGQCVVNNWLDGSDLAIELLCTNTVAATTTFTLECGSISVERLA